MGEEGRKASVFAPLTDGEVRKTNYPKCSIVIEKREGGSRDREGDRCVPRLLRSRARVMEERVRHIQGWSYSLGQRFSVCFVFKFTQQGEKRGSANFKTKHTEPLTQEITAPLYTQREMLVPT